MSTKRNEWLDAGDESEDVQHSDSDDGANIRKARPRKRPRLSSEREEEDQDLAEDILEDDRLDRSQVADSRRSTKEDPDSAQDVDEDPEQGKGNDDDNADGYGHDREKPARAKLPALTPAQLAARAKAKRKAGVVYISRIPPFMKPNTVRSYLSPHGEIGRLFLTPEDQATYQRRVRSGGNKKHSYIDGWVEFVSKKDAKMVAQILNGNIIGGKKGNYYHDDTWNIKYLHGFKWDDLTEQIQRENKEREARLRTEISRAKRENEAFIRDVERGKMVQNIQAKKTVVPPDIEAAAEVPVSSRKTSFKQKAVKDKRTTKRGLEQDESAARVLSKVL